MTNNNKKMNKIVVTIKSSQPCYLGQGWAGDPPRTHDITKARKFSCVKNARRAIELAKLTHPFQKREYDIELID